MAPTRNVATRKRMAPTRKIVLVTRIVQISRMAPTRLIAEKRGNDTISGGAFVADVQSGYSLVLGHMK